MKAIWNAIAIAGIFFGCSSSSRDRDKRGLDVYKETENAKNSFQDYACKSLADFPGSLPDISRNAKIITGGEDSCVVSLMDSIAARYIANGEEQYIACLGDICNASDGYVAEYMTDVMTDIFVSQADSAMHHLNKLRDKCLDKMLIWGLRREIYNPSGNAVGKGTIDSIIGYLLNSSKYSERDKRYLRELNREWEKKEDN